LPTVIRNAAPGITIIPADDIMDRLRSTLTLVELEKLRKSCRAAQSAFESACEHIQEFAPEIEIANKFRGPLSVRPITRSDGVRADGYVYVMSGPNSARAYAAYARSQSRNIVRGDLILVHCNSHVDGFWTDITRTYSLGEPSPEWKQAREAIFAAREAALSKIVPGVKASAIDFAARAELTARGYGPNFKHSTGHGVGFAAFDPNTMPRIHPASPDILREGMAFNIEPGIYIDGLGGMRHCDIVAVTSNGYELLTPFQTTPDDLVI
jgi:Xaa-Pro aminopeptidase